MNQYEELTAEEWNRLRLFRGLVAIAVIGGVAAFIGFMRINFLAGLIVFIFLEIIDFFFWPGWLVKTYAPFVLRCPECKHAFEIPALRFLFSYITISPLRLLEGGKGWVLFQCPECGEESRKIWMKKISQ